MTLSLKIEAKKILDILDKVEDYKNVSFSCRSNDYSYYKNSNPLNFSSPFDINQINKIKKEKFLEKNRKKKHSNKKK